MEEGGVVELEGYLVGLFAVSVVLLTSWHCCCCGGVFNSKVPDSGSGWMRMAGAAGDKARHKIKYSFCITGSPLKGTSASGRTRETREARERGRQPASETLSTVFSWSSLVSSRSPAPGGGEYMNLQRVIKFKIVKRVDPLEERTKSFILNSYMVKEAGFFSY